MTIAMGILAKDGVVIAADTEESIGYNKVPTLKIFSRIEPTRRAIALTGAGDAHYIDAINQQLARTFERSKTFEEAQKTIEREHRRFYADHQARLPREEQRDARTELLLGITWKPDQQVLLSASRNAVRVHKTFVACGAGADEASALLARLMPLREVLARSV